MLEQFLDIVFDGSPELPPGPPGRFVEVERPDGCSVVAGEWLRRPNGHWALRLRARDIASACKAIA
jgi:hypothetical protein